LQGKSRAALEEILPAYLKHCSWFQGNARQTEAAMILETIAFPYASQQAQIALIQVEYTEGEPETYLLPIAFASGQEAEEIRSAFPQSLICPLLAKSNDGEQIGILYDPLGEKRFSLALLEAVFRHRHFKRSGGELLASGVRHRSASFEFSRSL